MNVKFKKLHPNAVLPNHAKEGDAGADLTAINIERCGDNQVRHHYGIAVEIPENHVGLVFPRSSIFKHNARLSNAVGVVDSGYRGEVTAVMDFLDNIQSQPYNVGDRTAQLVIVPYITIRPEWSDELSETDRGANGYGSTGK